MRVVDKREFEFGAKVTLTENEGSWSVLIDDEIKWSIEGLTEEEARRHYDGHVLEFENV